VMGRVGQVSALAADIKAIRHANAALNAVFIVSCPPLD
jgi:hypothetical protein